MDFSKILICVDMDGTLLNDQKEIGKRDYTAIKRFISDGGNFTIATGRMQEKIRKYTDILMPTVPVIVCNGTALYDIKNEKYVKERFLPDRAKKVIDYIYNKYPSTAIEIYKDYVMYNTRENEAFNWHREMENFPINEKNYNHIPFPWVKAIFTQSNDETTVIANDLKNSQYFNEFSFTRSDRYFYEILPFGTSKGAMLKELTKYCGLDIKKTIAVGDNENDIELIREAGLGVAMENASDYVKSFADIITITNNEGGIAHIIDMLYSQKINL